MTILMLQRLILNKVSALVLVGESFYGNLAYLQADLSDHSRRNFRRLQPGKGLVIFLLARSSALLLHFTPEYLETHYESNSTPLTQDSNGTFTI